jgi:hypothetical protein
MGDDKAALREVHWRQLFPWLAIFRTFGIALDLKKMALGAAGALVTACGWWILATLFQSAASDNTQVEQIAAEVSHWPWDQGEWTGFGSGAVDPRVHRLLTDQRDMLSAGMTRELEQALRSRPQFELVDGILKSPVQSLMHLGTNWEFVLKPVTELVRPFRGIFGRQSGFVAAIFSLLCGIWGAVVWAFFGGAITRIAAIQFAREEKISIKESLQFASSKLLSFGGAPVIPLLFIAFFWLLCALGGVVACIPAIGDVFAGVLWILPMIAAFVMALIVVGWAVGWPLMFATISVEGSDSFDALSRSYAYAFQRPWNYLFYGLLAGIFGSLCSFFVLLFTDLIIHLSQWAVGWGGGSGLQHTLDQLFYYAPAASGWRPVSSGDAPSGMSGIAAVVCAAWLYLLFMMIVGFVYSYFWSASTVIYYLLRRDVDNTEMQEVYIEGEEEDEGMPMEPTPASPVATPSQPAEPGGG